MTPLQFIAIFTARAIRSDAKSLDHDLPKSQRDFHAGRREVYLQGIALWAECEVKDIREGILGTSRNVVPIKIKNEGILSSLFDALKDGA